MNKKIAISILAFLTIITLVMGILKISTAYEKKDEYYQSDTYSTLNKNVYVGGDAYNYIINGTYFTGYMVQGMGYLIISAMMGISTLYIAICKREEDVIQTIEDERLPEV